ncbi:MAG: transglutaminaseTgpA domain-containing protein [Cumulibacter sp.]
MNAAAVSRIAAPIIAGIATLATLATIGPVFSGQNWLLTSVAVIAAVMLSGIVLRKLNLAHAYVCVLQLLIGLYALLLLTCQPTLLAGFIPSGETFEHFFALLNEGANTARTQVAPIDPTPGTAALLAVLVLPVGVLVDDFTVTGRPALTGIPLLTLFAICAAIVREPISMWLVAIPLIAFLLLLWVADGERPATAPFRGAANLLSTGLILILAISVAAAVTVVVRLQDGGIFAVAGTKRAANETVARTTDLVGQLSRDEPIPLFTVTTDDPSPFYLRTLVLENWGVTGWSFANTQDDEVDLSDIPTGEISQSTATTHTTITVEQYNDIFVPTYYSPTSVELSGARYDRDMGVVFTDDKGDVNGRTYEITSQVPRPTQEELAAVTTSVPPEVTKNLVVPNDVDPSVVELTNSIVGSANTPWTVATALDDFFSDPAQGFIYDLQVPNPEGADPLASFLDKRVGYCEQYASAMASMFRISGVPARVVVGYTNGEQNDDGEFKITTDDAHAWVEAYFGESGWIPFDPTPIGDRSVPLSYAPSDQLDGDDENPSSSSTESTATSSAPDTSSATESVDPSAQAEADAADSDQVVSIAAILRWVLIAVLGVALLALPGVIRLARWHRRLATAGTGGAEGASAAWAELVELTDALGAPAVPTRGYRAQVDVWADSFGIDRAEFADFREAAERARYSAHGTESLASELRRARDRLRIAVGPLRWSGAIAVPRAVRRLLGR